MKHVQATSSSRHPDGYAGVIPVDDLEELARFAYAACRHEGPARLRRCAHSVLRSLICPCAWSEDSITRAIEQELVCADVRQRPRYRQSRSLLESMAEVPECSGADPDTAPIERDEQLDRALDEALADTFPASDPVALSRP